MNSGTFGANGLSPSLRTCPTTRIKAGRFPLQIQQTQSTAHPHAQRSAFHCRDMRLQSRSFARWNQSLRHLTAGHDEPALAALLAAPLLDADRSSVRSDFLAMASKAIPRSAPSNLRIRKRRSSIKTVLDHPVFASPYHHVGVFAAPPSIFIPEFLKQASDEIEFASAAILPKTYQCGHCGRHRANRQSMALMYARAPRSRLY